MSVLRRRHLFLSLLGLATALGLVLLAVPGDEPSSSDSGLARLIDAPPNVMMVVGLGDSVMAGSNCGCSGVTSQYADAWGRQIGMAVESVNFGVSGDTTATLRQRLAQDGPTRASLRRADMVLVIEGANDLVPQWQTWEQSSCDASCYVPAVDRMGSSLTSALRQVRALAPARAQVVVAGYWNVFPDGDAARSSEGPSFIGWSRQITRDANLAIERATRAERATYVDLTSGFFAEDNDPTSKLADDGDHPNQLGVDAIVQSLLAASHQPKSG